MDETFGIVEALVQITATQKGGPAGEKMRRRLGGPRWSKLADNCTRYCPVGLLGEAFINGF